MFKNVSHKFQSIGGQLWELQDNMGDNGLEVKVMTFERVHHGAFDKPLGPNMYSFMKKP